MSHYDKEREQWYDEALKRDRKRFKEFKEEVVKRQRQCDIKTAKELNTTAVQMVTDRIIATMENHIFQAAGQGHTKYEIEVAALAGVIRPVRDKALQIAKDFFEAGGYEVTLNDKEFAVRW